MLNIKTITMSTATSPIFDSLSGAYKDRIFRTRFNTIIMSARPSGSPIFVNENDRVARNIRADQFGCVNALVSFVGDAVQIGFPDRERNQSPANMFVRHNSGILVVSTPDDNGGFTREYRFDKMVLSAGPLEEADMTATVDTESRSVSFTLSALSEEDETSLCQPTDEVYGYVFDGETKRGRLVTIGARGDGGMTSFSIPAKWATTDLYVYAFVRAKRGRKASPTSLLYPAV